MASLRRPIFVYDHSGDRISNMYLYVIFRFTGGHAEEVWEYFLDDGRGYYPDQHDKPRFMYPSTYYFYVSSTRLTDPQNTISEAKCERAEVLDKAATGGLVAQTIRLLKIRITPAQDTYTVVLDKNGNASNAAYPVPVFEILGPPDFFLDIQVARSQNILLKGKRGFQDAAWLGTGTGIQKRWIKRSGAAPVKTPARVLEQRAFSSWHIGETSIKLDNSGHASYTMPLEWWQDLARLTLAAFSGSEEDYYFRVLGFENGTSDVIIYSTADGNSGSAPSLKAQNNLTGHQVIDLGYQQAGGRYYKSARVEFTVKEAHTTEMYTMVQWMVGGFPMWTGPGTNAVYPGHQLYNITHDANFPVRTVDSLTTNPRPSFFGGAAGPSVTADGLTAYGTDSPGAGLAAAYSHMFIHLDFETYIHLNFEVPNAVTITRQDGSPPVYGIIVGVIPDPAAVPPGEIHELEDNSWNVRMLLERTPAGVVVTHPNNFAGP
ncbi:MAG: hypothetical protein JXB88_15260 [Spirochaetales bacterium]|nr:hypothetical protein [Spirochaetales bacterium]